MNTPREHIGWNPQIRHDAIFGVMGVPLRFQTNSAHLFTLAVDAFARFGPPQREEPLLQMRLFTHPVDTSLPNRAWPVVTRGQGDYYYVTWGPGSTLVADLARGYLFGFLVPDAQSWPHLLRDIFLLEPVYTTLTRHDFVPLHVAVLLWRGRYPLYLVAAPEVDVGVLLYRAVRERWRLVAERRVMAVRTPRGWHFWGIPWWLHLPCRARHLFPELEHHTAAPQENGEWRLVLDVEDAWPGSTEPHAGPGPLILVREARRGEPDYDWLEPSELLNQSTFFPPHAPGWLVDSVHDVAAFLAEQGSYWLDMTDDLEQTFERLDELGERHWRP